MLRAYLSTLFKHDVSETVPDTCFQCLDWFIHCGLHGACSSSPGVVTD